MSKKSERSQNISLNIKSPGKNGSKGSNIGLNSVASSIQNDKWKDPKKWPKSLHIFIGRSFQLASKKKFNDNEVQQFKNQLKNLINMAISSGNIMKNNWDKQELPLLIGASNKKLTLYCDANDKAEKKDTKMRNGGDADSISIDSNGDVSRANDNKNSIKKLNIFGEEESASGSEYDEDDGYTPLPHKRAKPSISLKDSLRRLKKQKKEEQIQVRQAPISNSIKLTDKQKKELRSKRFERELSTPAASNYHETVVSTDPIVGKNQNLEKKYLRLTSQPNPETVRPLKVLRKTLQLLFNKYVEGAKYSYLCDQCKSMRQDLTVQNIKKDFSIMAYEFHSKLAIENGDWGEFNQCQSQLKLLYSIPELKKPNYFEFLAYRVLYYILTNNYNEVFELELSLINDNYSEIKNEYLDYALKIFKYVYDSDYYELSKLVRAIMADNVKCEDLIKEVNRGRQLSIDSNDALLLKHNKLFYFAKFIDSIMDRVNIQTLSIVCKGYRQLPVSYLKEILCKEKEEEFGKFLNSNNLQAFVIEDNSSFNCVKARLTVEDLKSRIFRKVDIKGQV